MKKVVSVSDYLVRLRDLKTASRFLLALGVACSVVACGAGNSDAARSAAIQKALDDKPAAEIEVPTGRVCGYHVMDESKPYQGLPDVHITPDGVRPHPIFKHEMLHCVNYAWDSSVQPHLENGLMGSRSFYVIVGRLVIDKVGPDQPNQLVGTVAPFTAHFVPNDLGTALRARNPEKIPKDIADGQAAMHKDANGQWIAQL